MATDEQRYKMMKLIAEGKAGDEVLDILSEPDGQWATEGFVDAEMDRAIEVHLRTGGTL